MTTHTVAAGVSPAATSGERRPRGRGALAKEIVLATVGFLGLVAIAWLVCSWAFGLTVVVFKTGSMSPTIPAGGAAISQQVPASDLEIGDVVTVQRPGQSLPVTHRVIAINAVPGAPDARSLVLRGDANTSPDLEPYVVEETMRVVVSAPGAGTALALLRSPFVLAVTTVIVGLLVVWAFWPQRRPTDGESAS